MQNNTEEDLRFTSVPLIQSAMDTLKTDHILIDQDDFKKKIDSYVNNESQIKEKYEDEENQNVHMIKFFWGHDHDFGGFKVSGLMGTRHIWTLSRFFDHFGVDPSSIRDMDILDVGCWTGGVSLILNKLGGRILAIDEIRKYIHALRYLVTAFGLKGLECESLSLYDLGRPDFSKRFDMVFCLGVIYHISDPIIGLRRIYNVMKPGALLCMESMSIDSDEYIWEYQGPSRGQGVFGWNWLIPSPRTLFQLLEDTGFEDIRVGDGIAEFSVTGEKDPMGPNRCFAVARRKEQHPICQAGLSVPID
jgi:tRNA (mo5U34)-methyltransferase